MELGKLRETPEMIGNDRRTLTAFRKPPNAFRQRSSLWRPLTIMATA